MSLNGFVITKLFQRKTEEMLNINGINGTVANFAKVSPRDLVVKSMYWSTTESSDDEGNATILYDIVTIHSSNAKNLDGTHKKMVRFSSTGQTLFLSQIPATGFYGPLAFSLTPEKTTALDPVIEQMRVIEDNLRIQVSK